MGILDQPNLALTANMGQTGGTPFASQAALGSDPTKGLVAGGTMDGQGLSPGPGSMSPGDAPGVGLDGPSQDAPPDTSEPVSEQAEAGMVSEFEELVMAPRYLMEQFLEMGDDRNYVAYDCMMLDTQDTVAVNIILRNQEISMGLTFPSNPECSCQPEEMVGDIVDPQLAIIAETAEKFANRMTKKGRLQPVFEGAMQDAMTCGLTIVKATLQEDQTSDPIGNPRLRDQQAQQIQYTRLMTLFQAGKFTADDPRYAELKALEDTMRSFVIGKLSDDILKQPQLPIPSIDPATHQLVLMPPPDARQARISALQAGAPVDISMLPEIPRQLAFTFDSIQPEDFRWDWKITKPEDFRNGDWIAHRVYMTDELIFELFGLTQDDMIHADQYMANGNKIVRANGEDRSPSDRNDYETNMINNRRGVWELHHKRHNRVYVWVSGMNRFAKNYVPEATWEEFYPFFPVYFHRLTGQAVPLSDTKLQRNLQDEYNMMRSHDREARRAAYPTMLIPKGSMSPGEMAKYEARLPFSIIEVERADVIKEGFKESIGMPYNPGYFNTANVQRDMQFAAGIPAQAGGVSDSGTELATDAAIANQRLNQANDRRTFQINRILTDIFTYVIQVGIRVFPEAYVKSMLGPMAMWPDMDAATVLSNIRIEVKAGTTGAPDKQKALGLWQNFSQICMNLGIQANGPEVLKEVLRNMGLRVDLARFTVPMMPGMPPPGGMPGQGPGGPPGPAHAGPPHQGPPPPSHRPQGIPGVGPQGGAPPMMARTLPPQPHQIPNRPMI
jgi:hypothetical protein